jgi:hypothetical protein
MDPDHLARITKVNTEPHYSIFITTPNRDLFYAMISYAQIMNLQPPYRKAILGKVTLRGLGRYEEKPNKTDYQSFQEYTERLRALNDSQS